MKLIYFQLNIPAFSNKNTWFNYDCFCGYGPCGKILTKLEPVRMLGFTLRLPSNKINAASRTAAPIHGIYLKHV